jgi:hypothetical protein
MSAPATGIDDYVDIILYVRDLDGDGATDAASRRLVRGLFPDTGTTLASLIQGESLDPIVLVAPSGTGEDD